MRGHDGQGGGQNKNYVALVDARKGNDLRKTLAPGNDALQERSWDVSELEGMEVRVELHDGLSGGAFAWIGVGKIDAGPTMQVDFSQGMPDGWKQSEREAATRFELLAGSVPFRRNASIYSVIPEQGDVEIPCGFTAQRLYLLGCTVGLAKPQTICAGVELHYASGAVDIIPLMVGFTLDNRGKSLSRSAAIHLHETADPFQYYLPVALRDEPLQMIRLVANPSRDPIPQLTAITVETNASHDVLTPLPASPMGAEELAWIRRKSVSPDTLVDEKIMAAIREADRLAPPPRSPVRFKKITLDTAFRSEGVAVADFNNDDSLDIATGNEIYLGPRWKLEPLLGAPKVFPVRGYSDSFLCFDEDINKDGNRDLIVVGFPGQATHWLENPGDFGRVWTKHLAVARTGNESPDFVDVDGDGHRELLFMEGKRCAVARPGNDPTEPWETQPIGNPGDPGAVHGLGTGDINGDGMTDIVIPQGWWQGPGKKTDRPWQFHAASFFGGAQFCVTDLDGDGDNDVLGSNPHGYGIGWTEQSTDGWQQHVIDDADSQTHAIHLADINRDGLLDFVTGKRFWAHNGHDPGSYQRAVLCWYELRRRDGKPQWIKHEIDGNSGVGLHFQIVDLDRDGRLDIVTSNKKGVFVFQQQ